MRRNIVVSVVKKYINNVKDIKMLNIIDYQLNLNKI